MAVPRDVRGVPILADLATVDGAEEAQQLAASPVGHLAVLTHFVSDPFSTESRPTDVTLMFPFQQEIHKFAHWPVRLPPFQAEGR
eukprot:2997718-Pyramimonas_sp.AAC.1